MPRCPMDGALARLAAAWRRPGARSGATLRGLTGEESGFTLVEFLVVMGMLTVVFGALVGPLRVLAPATQRDTNRTQANEDAQVGMARMTHEIRGATTVYSASATAVDFAVTSGGQTRRVRYDCAEVGGSYKRCARYWSTSLAASPTSNRSVVIDRVLNNTTADPSDPIFTYTPSSANPSFAKVHVAVPASAGKNLGYTYKLVLDDGVYMPNLGAQ